MPETPVLCLNMIVRNEGGILERCLESVAPFVGAYVIVDTGSTDDTKEVITRVLGLVHDVPGEIHDAVFEDFSQARNVALDAAEKSPLPFTHMLLVDADMQLCADGDEDAIVSAFESLNPNADSFLVPQLMGALRYHNIRIVRRGAGARYVGKTHEYLSTPQPWRPQIDSIHFHDHANGANRPEKYTRDERLLLAALAENPRDERAHYYLGQTYREMGRYEDALTHYRTRATMGGWEDEGWHAEFMMAHCLASLGREDEAIATALRAYQRRPKRLEPIHWLAKRFREQSKNHLAIMLAREGIGVPVPLEETLFLDTQPYNGGFIEELSIAGFYGRPSHRAQGLRACQHLSRRRDVADDMRATARANLVHYATTLHELTGGVSVQLHLLPTTEEVADTDASVPRYVSSSPSVAWISNPKGGRRLACAVRWINYRFFPTPQGGDYRSNDADGVVRTKTEIILLDPSSLVILERKPIHEACTVHRTTFPIQGFEDLRLFAHKDGVYATATARDLSPDGRAEIVLLTLREGADAWEIVATQVLPGKHPNTYDKNWMPVLDAFSFEAGRSTKWSKKPRIMAWVDPPTVLSFTDFPPLTSSTWREDSKLTHSFDDARGGGQVVRIQNLQHEELEYLGVVHRAQTASDGTRSYTHTFIGLDVHLHVFLESPPFVFQQAGLEFAAGLAVVGSDLLVSYHRLDRESWIHRVPLASVVRSLLPVGETL